MTFLTDTSRAGSHSGFGLVETVTRPFMRLTRTVRRYSEYSMAEAQLNALSDHTLADIGIARSEIHDLVWEDFGHE